MKRAPTDIELEVARLADLRMALWGAMAGLCALVLVGLYAWSQS